jgi:membrane-associated protein
VVGALLWVLLFTYAGYLFGDLPVVQENLKLLIVAIIVLSVLPGVIEIIRHKRAAAKQAKRLVARKVSVQRFDHFFIPCSGML